MLALKKSECWNGRVCKRFSWIVCR